MDESTVIDSILRESHTIAVVGLSDKPDRPSYGVAKYLQAHGYRIVPVNPGLTEVLGEPSYPDLASIPGAVDVVDIFRRSEDTPPVVEGAIAKGAKAVWMQEGIVNEAAAERARAAGLQVVMNLCIKKEHEKRSRQGTEGMNQVNAGPAVGA
jgi:predicted CoA-binding protein